MFGIFCSHDSFPKLWLRIPQTLRPSMVRVVQSVQRLPTGWTVRDRNPVETRFSSRPDWPWGPPSLLYNGYRVFPRGKVRPERAVDHSPPSSAAGMEVQSYTSTHPLGHTGPVTGSLYLFLYGYLPGFSLGHFSHFNVCLLVYTWALFYMTNRITFFF